MKSILITLAAIALTGCGTLAELQAEGQEIRQRGSMNNRDGFYTHTITTPSGTYTVRGSQSLGTRIYRNK